MPFRLSIRGSIIALSVLSAAFVAAPVGTAVAEPASALTAKEQEAVAFRRLQSELMVAALSCHDSRFTDQYNIFVTRFRPALSDNARVLKTYFKRQHGPMATRRLDAFITGLANDASLASMGDANFCTNALARIEAINYTDQGQTAGRIIEEAELVIEQ
jgi:hypothetical protein